MNAKVALSLCALSVAPGCGGSPSAGPVAPTALPAASAPSCHVTITCQILPFHISGIAIDDDGRPVAGAKVTIRPFLFAQSPPPITTTTNAAGLYRIEFEAMRDSVGGVGSVGAEQPGHENHWRYLWPSFTQEITQNFHLYREKRIAPEERVSMIVRADDTSCGFDGEWVCRTVRITAPQSGTLRVTLVSHNPQDETGLEVYERVPAGVQIRRRCCSPEASLEVGAGAEVIANILVWWDTKVSHSFTLRTSLVHE